MKFLLSLIMFFSLGFASEELVLDSANSFITTMRGARNAPIKELIEQSKATIIFPSVKKVGFVVGGMGGDGIMVVGNINSPSEILPVSIKWRQYWQYSLAMKIARLCYLYLKIALSTT